VSSPLRGSAACQVSYCSAKLVNTPPICCAVAAVAPAGKDCAVAVFNVSVSSHPRLLYAALTVTLGGSAPEHRRAVYPTACHTVTSERVSIINRWLQNRPRVSEGATEC